MKKFKKLNKEQLRKLAEAIKKSELEKEVLDPEKVKALLDIEFKENRKFSLSLFSKQEVEKMNKENKFIESQIEVESSSLVLEKSETFKKSSNLEQATSTFQLQEEPKEENSEKKYHQIAEDYRAPQTGRTQRDENLTAMAPTEKRDIERNFKPPVHLGESRSIEKQESFKEPQYTTKKLYKPR